MNQPNTHTSEAIVEVSGLTKTFKDFWGRPKAKAVNAIDFTIRRGQVFGLLGPNGSGKSTTIKMLLGLLYPTRGTIKVFGKSPTEVEIKNRIGYLPEESFLYKYLTAAETLDFFGALFGLHPEERQRRSKQLLEMVGLTNSANRPVGEFSKGMARRIGLAQALVNDPELVILDEPTSGLDPIGCREVKDIVQLLAKRGKTVILCSHLLGDIEDVCDEVVIMYGGKIRAQGTLEELLKKDGTTRIEATGLTPAIRLEVEKLLAANSTTEQFRISHSSMKLEEFFLDVVNKARAASLETSGAQQGGSIAAYLQADVPPGMTEAAKEEESRRLLTLLGKAEASAPVAAPTQDDGPKIDYGTLEKLARQEEVQVEATPATPPPSAEREAANKKLADLLKNG
jgi:ABC-2 type transport system ATP-binding protein